MYKHERVGREVCPRSDFRPGPEVRGSEVVRDLELHRVSPPSHAPDLAPRPEIAVLLAAGRRELREVDRVALLAAFAAGLDWRRLVALARWHRLLPLLYAHVATDPELRAAVPPPVREALHAEAIAAAQTALLLTADLVAILRAIGGEGIPVVPLKGPVLAQELYGSVGLRQFRDLDLLVASADLPAATAALVASGYVPAHAAPEPQGARELRGAHHCEFVGRSGANVELHHRLTSPIGRFVLGMPEVERELERTTFSGLPVTVLRPEALLVYLCIHGASHAWERLEWICGVAELLRSGRVVEWEAVIRLADRFGATRRLLAGVDLAVRLLDAPPPPVTLGRPGPRSERAVAAVVDRLLTRPFEPATSRACLTFATATDPDLRTRISRYGRAVFAPQPADAEALPMPPALYPLYTILRPIRLAFRAVRRAVGGAPTRDDR